MKRFLCVLIVLGLIWLLPACSKDSSSETKGSSSRSQKEKYEITESQAISIAKSSASVENDIAKKMDLIWYADPDYGTCTAKLNNSTGNWIVTLKGTISGYTDDYKSNFKQAKFKADVYLNDSGSVDFSVVQRAY